MTTRTKTRPTREALKAEFDRDPKIRDEFISAENYIGYRMAEAKGLVSVVKNKVQR